MIWALDAKMIHEIQCIQNSIERCMLNIIRMIAMNKSRKMDKKWIKYWNAIREKRVRCLDIIKKKSLGKMDYSRVK